MFSTAAESRVADNMLCCKLMPNKAILRSLSGLTQFLRLFVQSQTEFARSALTDAHLNPARQVVNQNELNKWGVYEEHADPVPQIHSGQVGDDRQVGPEPDLTTFKYPESFLFSLVAGGEEVQHGGDPEGNPSRLRIPLDPECDKATGHKDNT